MQLVRMDPPGTICSHEAVMEMVRETGARTFVEVGCGAGELSTKLCRMGLRGFGIDFSHEAIQSAEVNLEHWIKQGQFQLVHGDILELQSQLPAVDLGISMMVMEHVADDVAFLSKISALVRPGGHVIVAVPGRMDCWTFEDDTVGHLRRYERWQLEDVFRRSGLLQPEVWSVAVPTANLLLRFSDLLVRNSAEKKKLADSLRRQTETSGIREIPFKTVFPPFCRLILNRVTLSPLLLLQRLFYRTNLGLTMLAIGRVGATRTSSAQPIICQESTEQMNLL
jgi:SAM-dependent methyltransferase